MHSVDTCFLLFTTSCIPSEFPTIKLNVKLQLTIDSKQPGTDLECPPEN